MISLNKLTSKGSLHDGTFDNRHSHHINEEPPQVSSKRNTRRSGASRKKQSSKRQRELNKNQS